LSAKYKPVEMLVFVYGLLCLRGKGVRGDRLGSDFSC